jgi:glycosyltransferase involved in cell wall biosynthesis
MKLLLMIHSLQAGGAERVLTLIADGLASRGHKVYLLTLAGTEEDFFDSGKTVCRIGLNLAGQSKSALGAIWANLRRIRAIRGQLRAIKPDAVLSFTTSVNVLALLAAAGTPVPVIVSERVDPRAHVLQLRWRILRALAYRRAHALVVQTSSVVEWFRPRLPRRVPIDVIENPISLHPDTHEPEVLVPRPYILAAGRLSPQKGFDTLIKAFAIAVGRCAPLSLAIAGSGPEAEALARLASQRGLKGRVYFLGRVKALDALMRQAQAFVLSSRYEGFPNVLLEALACGVPVVSADCLSGPREILGDERYGILVPPENPRALAEAIVRITSDPALRERLSMAGLTRAAYYHPSVILGKWEQILRAGGASRTEQVFRT